MDTQEQRVPVAVDAEPEVTNPGYPGALMILGVPVLLFGVFCLITGSWLMAILVIPGGVGLIAASVRAKRQQIRKNSRS